jgi:hypothetical protein
MSASLYRHLATECLRHANLASDQNARSSLRRMAIGWADLADQAERNSRTDAEYRLPDRAPEQA